MTYGYGIRELLKAWSQEDTFLNKDAVACFRITLHLLKLGIFGLISYGCSYDELMVLVLEKVSSYESLLQYLRF